MTQASPDGLFERAALLLDLGRPVQAEVHIAAILAADPASREGLLLLAKRLVADGRYDEAAQALRQLLAAHPGDVAGMRELAAILLEQGHGEQAELLARRALELEPDDAGCLYALSWILAGLADRQREALVLADRLVELAPHNPQSYLARAHCLRRQDRWRESEQATLAALALDPGDATARLQLAIDRIMLRKYGAAAEDAAAALRANPQRKIIEGFAHLAQSLGIPDSLAESHRLALSVLGRADVRDQGAAIAAQDPALLQSQVELAACMLYAGRHQPGDDGYRQAGELLSTILEADPTHQLGRHMRAEVLQHEGRNAEALTVAEGLLAEGYGPADLRQVLAQCQFELGRHDEALETIQRARRMHPDNSALFCHEAVFLRGLGRPGEGLAVARRGAATDPESASIQLEVGLCAQETGDLETAERALRAAMAAEPENAEAVGQLAGLLAGQDRWADAGPLLSWLTAHAGGAAGARVTIFGLALHQLGGAMADCAEDVGPQHMAEVARRADQALDIVALLPERYEVGGEVFTRASRLDLVVQGVRDFMDAARIPPNDDHGLIKVMRRVPAL